MVGLLGGGGLGWGEVGIRCVCRARGKTAEHAQASRGEPKCISALTLLCSCRTLPRRPPPAAVNVLLHVQLPEPPPPAPGAPPPPRPRAVGAIWDVARRCDAGALRAWLSANTRLFKHGGQSVSELVPEGADLIHEQVAGGPLEAPSPCPGPV
jgi:hypothetical protein